MAEESSVPRVQRNRFTAGTGWRMRLHRARPGNYGRANRADGQAGDLVLPDDYAVLRRLGSRRHAGRKTRPRESSRARNEFQESAERAFENCVWNRHRRDAMGRIYWTGDSP